MIFPIFEDMTNPDEKDKFPNLPFPQKPSRRNKKEYKRRLEEASLTRSHAMNDY